MLNRIAFIFYFFIFLGKAGGAREYHTALPSASFSTGFHFLSYLMFFFFFGRCLHINGKDYRQASSVRVLPQRVFSLMRFSQLCVFIH